MTKRSSSSEIADEKRQTSLSTAAARNLTTTTKTPPQMQMEGITPRWLLRLLPWVDVSGGVYRVNRRLSYALGDGTISFTSVGSDFRVIPQELCELPLFQGFEEVEILEALADRFEQREYAAGDFIVKAGEAADRIYLLAQGRATKVRAGKYGDLLVLGALTEGDHFGARTVVEREAQWEFSVEATTPCTVLTLDRKAFTHVVSEYQSLRTHLESIAERLRKPQDSYGQSAIDFAAGHKGETELPTTFVNYEHKPREYELSVAQIMLHIHTRVADLYNGPMDQVQEQLRLTIEALRECQEYELINNPEFGLLHNVDSKQRISTRSGPPTPDDMDEILCRRRRTQAFLAQPDAIAAFGRECNRRGIYPETVLVEGQPAQAWRGTPILPCTKIPISDANTTSIIGIRFGAERQGVIGLRPATLPDEVEPGLNVRFMGINEKAIMRYLVSTYYSIAALVPDAFGVLDNVELGR